MSLSKSTLGAALAVSAASLVIGCGNRNTEVPVTSPPDGGFVYDAGGPAFPPPPPPPPDAGAPAPQAGPCDPVQIAAMGEYFKNRVKAEAPGMTAEGVPVCGIVPDGQSTSGPLMVLQPGHCYSVLAQALPNVSQIDVQLVSDPSSALPPMLAALAGNPVLAVGDSAGVQATLGGKGNCYQWPWPIPWNVKVVVKSKAGAGLVSAQVYSKKK